MTRLRPSLLALLPAIFLSAPAHAGDFTVAFPVNDPAHTQSLDGTWAFKYIPSLSPGADAGFTAPTFDVSAWKTIPVPSCWECEGFAEPNYGLRLADGLGLYRRTFRVPSDWSDGRRVILHFEGVAYGFEAWVNGVKVGASSASAYNPDTFDITDALKAGADNVLAVQISTKPPLYEFDVNDDWSLSGIFRDITVFSIPATHVEDISTATKLAADGSADFSVHVTVSQAGARLAGRLVSPDGSTALPLDFSASSPKGAGFLGALRVPRPALWTAETPSLYTLRLTLSDTGGRPLQTLERRVGLREISIKDGVLLLNGRPVKFRGVDHHDLDPIDGRAITRDEELRDLRLMKRANINAIRTSHYPPQPCFIELCDELGFYLIDEIPLPSRGGSYLKDPACRKLILARVDATVTRDKNHPSVIVWSVGNENRMNDGEIAAARRAKELDPTRPVTLPKTAGEFGSHYRSYPECIDIFDAHYPSTDTLQAWATRLKRPTLFTEYAHAQGLATDHLESQWAIMQATPRYVGGCIWLFQDQGLLRSSKTPVNPEDDTVYAWPDRNHYYDTGEKRSSKTKGLDGVDGIVYADRTPQTDYWEVRKVYAPVHIPETSASVEAGPKVIAATVENRYDFRSLAGMKLDWSLLRNGRAIQHGVLPLGAPSHGKETVKIPVTIPSDAAGDVLALELRCVDESGLQITERAMRLELAGAWLDAWLAALPAKGMPRVAQTAEEVTVRHANFEVRVARATGELSIRDRQGRVLVSGIYPHPGRKRLMSEKRGAESRFGFWPASILTSVQDASVKVSEDASGVRLTVSGKYPRPRDARQMLAGGYEATITPGGAIAVRYRYEPIDAKGNFAEAGLSVVMPAEFSEFRWIGDGPYPGYPGKERLDEFGLFHLNRADLRFQGNRRRTEVAMLTTPEGAGLALVTAASDVSVERDEKRKQTLLSHNAVISSLGSKIGGPETLVKADKTAEISGSFTLVPLGDSWPAALTRWFGQPAAAKDVFKPFYHSYDQ